MRDKIGGSTMWGPFLRYWWAGLLAALGFLAVGWFEGGLQYWSQSLGTYDPKNWWSWLSDLYFAIPPGVTGLILGFALGVCVTALVYDFLLRGAPEPSRNRTRQNKIEPAIELRRKSEDGPPQLRTIGNLCERASGSMLDTA
jgi:hypothetical protein